MDVSVAQDCSDFPPTGGSNPSQSRRTPLIKVVVQPLELSGGSYLLSHSLHVAALPFKRRDPRSETKGLACLRKGSKTPKSTYAFDGGSGAAAGGVLYH